MKLKIEIKFIWAQRPRLVTNQKDVKGPALALNLYTFFILQI